MRTCRTVHAVIALLLGVLLLGCAAKRAIAPGAPSPTTESAAPRSADALSAGGGGGATEPAVPEEAKRPASDRKIITSGNMTIEVRDLSKALQELARLVKQGGGFLASRNVTANEAWRRAEVTVRVPADQFDRLHDGVEALGEVTHDEQQGEDVTKQWQDLEARIKVRQAKEQSLMRLMQQQASLSDLLEVEKQLWDVREQIEQAQGELRYLRDKVTLATLTISLNEQVPAGVGKIGPWNLGFHVKNAVQVLVRVIKALLIALIYVVIVGVIVWLPLWLLIRWVRRRPRQPRIPPPPPPGAQQ